MRLPHIPRVMFAVYLCGCLPPLSVSVQAFMLEILVDDKEAHRNHGKPDNSWVSVTCLRVRNSCVRACECTERSGRVGSSWPLGKNIFSRAELNFSFAWLQFRSEAAGSSAITSFVFGCSLSQVLG